MILWYIALHWPSPLLGRFFFFHFAPFQVKVSVQWTKLVSCHSSMTADIWFISPMISRKNWTLSSLSDNFATQPIDIRLPWKVEWSNGINWVFINDEMQSIFSTISIILRISIFNQVLNEHLCRFLCLCLV